MDLDALDAVQTMIQIAQDLMITTSQIGWRLAATIAGIALLLAAAIRVAGGGGGIVPYVVQWIILTGLVLGLLGFWPTVMVESFNTADEVARLLGSDGLSALDVIAQGYGLYARVVESGMQGAIWNLINPAYTFSVILGAIMLILHVLISLIIAAATLQFWIAGAALPILVPFIFINGLSGLGFGVIIFIATSVLKLIFLAIIVTVGQQSVFDLLIPDSGSVVELWDVTVATINAFVVLYLAAEADKWGTTIARGAIGGTGITSLAFSILRGTALGRGGGSPRDKG